MWQVVVGGLMKHLIFHNPKFWKEKIDPSNWLPIWVFLRLKWLPQPSFVDYSKFLKGHGLSIPSKSKENSRIVLVQQKEEIISRNIQEPLRCKTHLLPHYTTSLLIDFKTMLLTWWFTVIDKSLYNECRGWKGIWTCIGGVWVASFCDPSIEVVIAIVSFLFLFAQ